MTGSVWLDGALFALSLFNTILLLWLGLTVLLNAERRSWGLWLAGGGLLVGSGFFVSHTAILSHSLTVISRGTDVWWRLGWVTLVGLPYSWYVLMLWYTGFWEESASRFYRRHRVWLVLLTLATALLLAVVVTTPVLPGYQDLRASGFPLSASLPWPFAVYPLYSVTCIALALRALARPLPSPRAFGDLARRRARPWLVGTSLILLVVSLLVSVGVGWFALRDEARAGIPTQSAVLNDDALAWAVGWFDLVITFLIAVAVVCLGQAIVAYEIFTGQSLPRRGFARHWRRAVILAAGYSMAIGAALAVQLRAIYSLLLTTVVMTTFYAMLVWRTFVDRQRSMAQLRPLVRSPQLYDQLLGRSDPSAVAHAAGDADSFFRTLCDEVLGATFAALLPLGASTALVDRPLATSYDRDVSGVDLLSLLPRFEPLAAVDLVGSNRQRNGVKSSSLYQEIDPETYLGARWAVALWQEDGLVGVLLLGSKREGGLYSLEEMELAQAAGERLLDLMVSAEMGRRLVALQRQRLTETQLADQRVRRVLHDDVLPELHAAMLSLAALSTSANAGAGQTETDAVVSQLAEMHHRISDLLHEMPVAGTREVARLGIIGALRRVIERELTDTFDTVDWQVDAGAEALTWNVPPMMAEVIFFAAREAVRNAARYGRRSDGAETSPASRSLALTVTLSRGDGLTLRIVDDGVGIHPRGTSDAGSGQGLALHSTMMAVIGGSLRIQSAPDQGTTVTLTIPDAVVSPAASSTRVSSASAKG